MKASKTRARIVMRESNIHGRGVFALRRISAGDRVVEYRGARISHEEADALYPDYDDEPSHTFLFALDDGETVIDANQGGNVARWINHSCEPNCESDIVNGRVYIHALRDIAPGEELTYDYNITFEERHTRALKERYRCICGAAACRGTLLAEK